MNESNIIPKIKLTVIIGDMSRLHQLDESITRRTVTIKLTDEQKEKLMLRHTHTEQGQPYHEFIITSFLEGEI